MKNCKADNIAEKLSKSYLKQGKSSLCKKCYEGLTKNSRSVDVNAFKNALLRHQDIYQKISTVGAVQVFSLELHPSFHFLRYFLLGTPIFRNTRECAFVFALYFFDCNVSSKIYSLCFYSFLPKVRRPVLFSTS